VAATVGPDARVVAVETMAPSSTEQYVFVVERAGDVAERLVLRRYHDASRLGSDPWYVPTNEARTLQLLAATPVPAPRLRAFDLEGTVCGVPALLETWVPGRQAWHPDDVDAYLASAAETLVAIHRIDAAAVLPTYAPYYDLAELRRCAATRSGPWPRVIDAVAGAPPPSSSCFIHRDYHPGNALTDGARVTAVVDWATAAWGPPGIDLARMRQNLASHLGTDAGNRFVSAYVAAGGDPGARHPYWDLLDAADSIPDLGRSEAPGGGSVERFEGYVATVLAEL
jgi:aminoglycoside phosphotransferase (APT) family kinase protein